MKKDQPKTERQILQEFAKEYQALCEKYQCQIIITPAYRARDDGTWSTVLQTSVGRLPRENVVK